MFDEDVAELLRAGVVVDLMVTPTGTSPEWWGIRLRTVGKRLPKERMVLGKGVNFEAALQDALGKAADGRWERLDWDVRPWGGGSPTNLGKYGL